MIRKKDEPTVEALLSLVRRTDKTCKMHACMQPKSFKECSVTYKILQNFNVFQPGMLLRPNFGVQLSIFIACEAVIPTFQDKQHSVD